MSGQSKRIDGFASGARPLCIFCNEPWSDDMVKVFVKTTTTECGYYQGEPASADVCTRIDINCHKCGRLIYQKEIDTHYDGY